MQPTSTYCWRGSQLSATGLNINSVWPGVLPQWFPVRLEQCRDGVFPFHQVIEFGEKTWVEVVRTDNVSLIVNNHDLGVVSRSRWHPVVDIAAGINHCPRGTADHTFLGWLFGKRRLFKGGGVSFRTQARPLIGTPFDLLIARNLIRVVERGYRQSLQGVLRLPSESGKGRSVATSWVM